MYPTNVWAKFPITENNFVILGYKLKDSMFKNSE
jgi:hypothetical protein